MESNKQILLPSVTNQDSSNSLITSTQTLSNESIPISAVSVPIAAEEVSNNGEPNYEYFKSFPTGYRFLPSDEELVVCYLKKKLENKPLPPNQMVEVDLYEHNPEYFAEEYKDNDNGENGWYFFTPRYKGLPPNRSAGDGYWKATGADRAVHYEESLVGYKKALVFYSGKAPKGIKTTWIMHEYRLNERLGAKSNPNDMRLNDCVLCKIFEKDVKDKDQRNTGSKTRNVSVQQCSWQ